MIANVINFAAIIVGSVIGMLFKKVIRKELCELLLKVIGVVIIIFSILGIIKAMVTIDNNLLTTNYELLLLISLVLGTIIGEILKIDNHITKFANYIERKVGRSHFALGFVTASLIFGVGAMAIVGSIKAGLGEPNILYLKALIDGVTAIILASTLGIGVLFSAFIIFFYQGLIIIIIFFLGDIFDSTFIDTFSMVGYALVFFLGLNFLRDEKIKVANMLPSLVIVILYNLII